jgi:hypothetical protein
MGSGLADSGRVIRVSASRSNPLVIVCERPHPCPSPNRFAGRGVCCWDGVYLCTCVPVYLPSAEE